jgi:hypothetical protein
VNKREWNPGTVKDNDAKKRAENVEPSGEELKKASGDMLSSR